MQSLSVWQVRQRFQKGPSFTVDLQRDFGDLLYMDVPLLPRVYYLFHPAHIHALLVENAAQVEKPALITRAVKSSFGNGLFTSAGTFWRRQRRIIQPTFHHARIGQFAERIVAHTQTYLKTWHDGDLLNIDAAMHALTLTIVVDALFSADVSGQTEIIGNAMHDLGGAVAAKGNSLIMSMLPDWVPLPVLRRSERGIKTINTIIYQMVNERRALGEASSPPDLLSALVFAKDAETGDTMIDEQVRDELMTLFIAGHETTAVLLGWIWVLLAQNPEVEAKLHTELDAELKGQQPTLADLPRLIYTAQIVKEALRLYPPAWFVMRQAKTALNIDGQSFPKNALFFLFPYAAQHDGRWFTDPEQFSPERWQNDFEKTLPKGAYFPFGMGPRVCIGNGFAVMEAQLILAIIAQRYRIEQLTEAKPIAATTTLAFEKPVQVRLHKR